MNEQILEILADSMTLLLKAQYDQSLDGEQILEKRNEYVGKLEEVIKQRESEAVKAFAEKVKAEMFAEPCEPDCDKIRHAYHEGQRKMEKQVEEIIDHLVEKEFAD